jgi:hypothetical protein
MKLLTTNTKLEKDNSYHALGIQLAPFTLGGYGNVCTSASEGCSEACLFSAGRGAMPNVKDARIARTKKFFTDKTGFMTQLFNEIVKAEKSAKRKGLKLALRLNVLSDLPWEKIKHEGKTVFETFPQITFYDYTKHFKRAMSFAKGEMPSNYHLTFSRSESNENLVKLILELGGNVACVFRNELPKTWQGKKVIDGDKSDLRFLDDSNVVVGLAQKGMAKKDETGFVIG